MDPPPVTRSAPSPQRPVTGPDYEAIAVSLPVVLPDSAASSPVTGRGRNRDFDGGENGMTPVASCKLLSSLPANEFGRRPARRTARSGFSAYPGFAWLTSFRIACTVYQKPRTEPEA